MEEIKVFSEVFNHKSILMKCLSVLIIAFLISFLTVAVFAVSVDGSEYSFSVGRNNYKNFSSLLYTQTDRFIATTSLTCENGSLPAGYLGACARIYKQNSNGSTYSLVSQGAWSYSTGTNNQVAALKSYSNPAKGYYIGSGQTAVYYNGDYQRDWTYGTPLIQVK